MLRKLMGGVALLTCLLGPALAEQSKPEMLLYCGITMVRPMTEIAHLFEKRENVRITIVQGGSEDLYQSARKSGLGDWYLPGEPSYRDKHLADGLLGDYVTVGYNQMALVVAKGNPKQVTADPNQLLRKDLTVVIGNAESGSVGQEAKRILDQLGIYPRVVRAAAYLAPDSRSLMGAMRKGEADATMSWRATAFFPDNAGKVDVLDLDMKLAPPQALLLNLLRTTRDAERARRFMNFAASEEGQSIFRRYGFLDNRRMTAR